MSPRGGRFCLPGETAGGCWAPSQGWPFPPPRATPASDSLGWASHGLAPWVPPHLSLLFSSLSWRGCSLHFPMRKQAKGGGSQQGRGTAGTGPVAACHCLSPVPQHTARAWAWRKVNGTQGGPVSRQSQPRAPESDRFGQSKCCHLSDPQFSHL